MVFVSGQLPIDPLTRVNCTGSAGEQAAQALSNVEAVLEAAGTSLNQVLKMIVYISDIAMWAEIDSVYRTFFGDHKPARSVVPTRKLHHGFKVKIEAIAAV